MQSAAKPQKLSRTDDFELLTRAAKAELADDRLCAAMGTFREAVNLSRGLPDLEEAAVRLGMELARQVLPLGSRLAKSLIEEAAAVDFGKMIPAELWRSIEEQEREEAISGALNYRVVAVRQRLSALLERYPGEARLLAALRVPESAPACVEAAVAVRVGVRHRWTQLLATAATVIFTVGALGLAGGLIWNRQPHKKASRDDLAWLAVNPRNADLVESYLMSFPHGAHRGQAVEALTEIRIERRESAELRQGAH